MPINRKFCDKTSYGDSYNPVAVSPVQPYRCVTEMSNPSGDINFETTTGELVVHKYGFESYIEDLIIYIYFYIHIARYNVISHSLIRILWFRLRLLNFAGSWHTGFVLCYVVIWMLMQLNKHSIICCHH